MAAEISAQLVRELRERTGAGMMDCKRALQETNGDIEAAVVLLREKGMANAAKRADRLTTEGLVGYHLADDRSRGCAGDARDGVAGFHQRDDGAHQADAFDAATGKDKVRLHWSRVFRGHGAAPPHRSALHRRPRGP